MFDAILITLAVLVVVGAAVPWPHKRTCEEREGIRELEPAELDSVSCAYPRTDDEPKRARLRVVR